MPDGAALPEPSDELRAVLERDGREIELLHYADLETVLDEAGEGGILDVPAESAARARAGQANRVRDGVISERLWLLGYLPHRDIMATSEHAGERAASLAAVTAFQQDAGLVGDGSAGPVTWAALQELVTFETPTDVRRYVRVGRPLPALARAVRLRLWALGFLDEQPRDDDVSETLPELELDRFILMLKRFERIPYDDPVPDVSRRIERLFDQDAILQAIAAASRPERIGGAMRWVFRYLKESRERREDTDPVVERFLACVAKVELWLLGFDVDIAPVRDFPVYRFRRRDRLPANDKVSAALVAFWEMAGWTGPHLRRYLTPELFQVMADPAVVVGAGAAESWDEPDYSQRVLELVRTGEDVERAWAEGRGLGMRLWDGLKRLWRWIRRGVEKIVAIGLNVARAFFRFATKSYEIARAALSAAAQAMMQYVAGEIGVPGGARVLLGRDGDVATWVPDASSGDDLRGASGALAYFGAAFALACKILAAIMRALRAAIMGAGAAIIGWARFLWILVDVYREIRPAYLEMNALQGA